MHDIDVNFVKRRKGDVFDKTTVIQKPATPIEEKIPVIAGGVVLVLLPLAAMGLLMLTNKKIAQIEQENLNLDAEITRLQSENQRIAQLDEQINQANAEAEALASVFNQLKPMSAVLEDISANVPPGVQIDNITQSQLSPTEVQLNISGVGQTYDDVNDFLLALQASEFLNPDVTRIQNASLQDLQIQQITNRETLLEKLGEEGVEKLPNEYKDPRNFSEQGKGEEIELNYPQVVNYQIVTMLNNKPANELIEELTRKGAVGLVTRIKTLEEKGVIQP